MIKICPSGYVSVHVSRFDNKCITYIEYQQSYTDSENGTHIGIGMIGFFLVAFVIFHLVIKPFVDN